MTTKRRIQLKSRPLTCTELIEALSTRDPVYKEEEEAFLRKFTFFHQIKKI